jgi:NAD(P)H-hydrate epimerase
LLLPHELGVISAGAADVLTRNLERATALLIGPGFGLEETTGVFLADFLTGKLAARKATAHIGFVHDASPKTPDGNGLIPPLVLDADGLKLLAKIPDWHTGLPGTAVLTPHPGEMAVLTGLSVDEIQADRESIAARFAKEWGHVVVLKGAFTVVAAPDGRTTVIPVASAALARAGTGDVLAGLIAGLRAQGLNAFDAAVAGAWIHARAGLEAAEALGSTASVLAGDVLAAIPDVISDLTS